MCNCTIGTLQNCSPMELSGPMFLMLGFIGALVLGIVSFYQILRND